MTIPQVISDEVRVVETRAKSLTWTRTGKGIIVNIVFFPLSHYVPLKEQYCSKKQMVYEVKKQFLYV